MKRVTRNSGVRPDIDLWNLTDLPKSSTAKKARPCSLRKYYTVELSEGDMDKDLGDLRKADKEATVGATASSGAVPGDRAHIVEVIPRRTKTAPAPPSLASTRGAGAAAEVEGGGAGCKGSGSSSGTDGGSGADDRTPERGSVPPKINVQDRLLAEVEAQQRDSPGLCQEPGKHGDEAGGSCTVGNLFAASAAAKMPAAGELSTRTLLRAGANVAGAAHGTGGGGEGISVPVQERHDGVPAAAGGGGGGVLGCEPNDSLEGASRDSVKRVLEGGDGGGLAEMGFGGGRASKRVKLETRGGGEEGRGGGGKGQGEGGDGSEVESTVKIAGGDADCEGKPMGVSSTSNTSGSTTPKRTIQDSLVTEAGAHDNLAGLPRQDRSQQGDGAGRSPGTVGDMSAAVTAGKMPAAGQVSAGQPVFAGGNAVGIGGGGEGTPFPVEVQGDGVLAAAGGGGAGSGGGGVGGGHSSEPDGNVAGPSRASGKGVLTGHYGDGSALSLLAAAVDMRCSGALRAPHPTEASLPRQGNHGYRIQGGRPGAVGNVFAATAAEIYAQGQAPAGPPLYAGVNAAAMVQGWGGGGEGISKMPAEATHVSVAAAAGGGGGGGSGVGGGGGVQGSGGGCGAEPGSSLESPPCASRKRVLDDDHSNGLVAGVPAAAVGMKPSAVCGEEGGAFGGGRASKRVKLDFPGGRGGEGGGGRAARVESNVGKSAGGESMDTGSTCSASSASPASPASPASNDGEDRGESPLPSDSIDKHSKRGDGHSDDDAAGGDVNGLSVATDDGEKEDGALRRTRSPSNDSFHRA